VAEGQTKVQARIQSRVLARVTSAVPVLPPRLAVIEIFVLLVVPAFLEWQWPQVLALTTYQPHPYWAAVLLLSLQYGTVSGLLAAALAIVATAIIGLPEPDIGENHFAYLVRVWTQPVLWISAALLLGHFRMRQIQQRNELTRAVEELQGRSIALTGHADGLAARCDALERRLAVRPKSDATALLNALSAMPAAITKGTWSPAFDAALQAGFPGASASVYAFEGTAVHLVARSGVVANRSAPRFSQRDALVRAVAQGRELSALSGLDDELLSGFGPFAVPVYRGDAAPAGLLLIEALPSALVDQGTASRLDTFAAAIGQTMPLAQAGPVDAAVAEAGLDQTTAASLEPVIAIPVVPRWRQSRWLPAALRATDTARDDQADTSVLRRPTSSVSR
jgi:hypothetical protein